MTTGHIAYVNAWLLKAEHDIISAERLLEKEPMIFDNACFHCQQASEKYLKAFLSYHGKEIQKTHNIIFLLSECSNMDGVFASVDPGNINAYAVLGRYPDGGMMPEIEEAQSHYQFALQIKSLVLERIVFPTVVLAK